MQEQTRGSTVFERLVDIICEIANVKKETITLQTDLRGDCGIYGDDGDEVLEAIDREFDIDWSELEIGIHFGNEGCGQPLPWHMKNNCEMYETQPLTVGDLVDAVKTGKLKATPVVKKARSKRFLLYFLSILQFTAMVVFLALFGALLYSEYG